MYCKNCGKEISETAKFCDGCGKPVEKNNAPKSTKRKKPSTLLCVLIMIAFMWICITIYNGAKRIFIPENQKEVFISEFYELSGMKESTGEKIYSLLTNDLHFRSVSLSEKNKKQDVVYSIIWFIDADGYDLNVTADDDGIYHVFIYDTPDSMWFYRDGNILATKDDIK